MNMKAYLYLIFPKFGSVCIAEPVGLCFLAAILNKNKVSNTIDFGFLVGDSMRIVADRVVKEKPTHLGISVNTEPEKKEAGEFVRTLRKKGFKGLIFGGGLFAGIQTENLLNEIDFDFLVIGEAERTIIELSKLFQMEGIEKLNNIAYKKEGKIVKTLPRTDTIKNLDELPFMDRSILKEMVRLYKGTKIVNATLITNRGCFGDCKFCGIKDFYKSLNIPCYRERSIGNIVDEIETIVKGHKITDFFFCSPVFLPLGNYGLVRAKEFKEQLQDRGLNITYFAYLRVDHIKPKLIEVLKDTGLRTVFIGVESFDDKMLQLFNKRITREDIFRAMDTLREYGYSTSYDAKHRIKVGYITFTSTATKESLLEQIKFMKAYKIPAKKLANIFEILNERDCGAKTIQGDVIKHNIIEDCEIDKVYRQYKAFFKKQLVYLEKIRSLQKSVNDIDSKEEKKLFLYLDYLNGQCYDAFSNLLAGKPIVKFEKNIKEEFEKQNFQDIIDKYINKSTKNRLAYEYRLQRVLNNPQFV